MTSVYKLFLLRYRLLCVRPTAIGLLLYGSKEGRMVDSDYVRALSGLVSDIGFILAICLLMIIFYNFDGELLAVLLNNYSESD